MGSYPAFLVGNFYNILRRQYQLNELMIQRETGVSPDAIACGKLDFYPNDAQALRLIRLLDEVGFYSERELALLSDPRRRESLSPSSSPLLNIVFAELRNEASLLSFLKRTASRFEGISSAHHLWIEEGKGWVRLCHQFRNREEAFAGPQALFLFICNEIASIFPSAIDSISLNFPKFGIRDASGFIQRVSCTVDFWGPISYLQVEAKAGNLHNARYNPAIASLIGSAIGGLLPPPVDEMDLAKSIRTLIDHNLAERSVSLDIDAVADLLGMSRTTIHRRLKDEGTTFSDLRQTSRLDQAMKLLSSTNLDIALIGDRLGFSATSAFSRSFKTFSGLTPVEFRRRSQPES